MCTRRQLHIYNKLFVFFNVNIYSPGVNCVYIYICLSYNKNKDEEKEKKKLIREARKANTMIKCESTQNIIADFENDASHYTRHYFGEQSTLQQSVDEPHSKFQSVTVSTVKTSTHQVLIVSL